MMKQRVHQKNANRRKDKPETRAEAQAPLIPAAPIEPTPRYIPPATPPTPTSPTAEFGL